MLIKRFFIYLIAVLLCIGCKKELNQLPETQILADNFYKTQDNVELTVTAAYSKLQDLYDYYMILWGEIPSDNTFVQAPNSNGGVRPLEDFSWTSTTGFVTNIWKDSYKGILYANTVLDIIDEVKYDDDNLKNIRKGEMKFIRGLLYSNLTTVYGDVPLVLNTAKDPTYAFGDTRTPIADVYTQIEQDLLDAIGQLPQTNSAGRANKYAALAILARHYMTKQAFEKAEPLLETIVSSGVYALVGLDKLYGVANEGNKEDVFSVQYASDLNGQKEGNGYYYYFTLPDDKGGMGAMAVEDALYTLYVPEDLRRNLILPSGNVYYINKWTLSPNSNKNDGGDNHYIVRYADVLLRYAEALNETGKTNDAAIYLNMVRNRAGLSNITSSNQSQMRDAIAIERRLELVGEGHRWPDLLRTSEALTIMNDFFRAEGRNINVESFRLLAPLPQTEVDITKMNQNPNY